MCIWAWWAFDIAGWWLNLLERCRDDRRSFRYRFFVAWSSLFFNGGKSRYDPWKLDIGYIFLFVFFGRVYDAFLVSYNRVSEMVYSQMLAACVSDGFIAPWACHSRSWYGHVSCQDRPGHHNQEGLRSHGPENLKRQTCEKIIGESRIAFSDFFPYSETR